VRALPAGLAIVAAIAATRGRAALPSGSWWWRSAILGVLNIGLFFPLLFVAAYLLPGGIAAVAGAVGPFVVAALAYPLLRLTPSGRTILAGLAGLLGVALVVARPGAALDPVGLAAAAGGMLSMSLGTVLGRRWGTPPAGLLPLTGWQLTAGGLLLAPLTLAVEGLPDALTPGNVAGFGYLSVAGAIVAYTLWLRGVVRLAPTQASMLSLISPVVATILGWLVLAQALGPVQLVGAGLTLGAVAAGATARPRPRR
jgi:probable blue pigment (indigoidine) exporter